MGRGSSEVTPADEICELGGSSLLIFLKGTGSLCPKICFTRGKLVPQ